MKTIQNIAFASLLSTLLLGCGQTGVTEFNADKKIKSVNNASLVSIQDEGLTYLNQLRVSLGMLPFQRNNTLEIAALNHAQYLTSNNIFSHYESQSTRGFSGVNPSNRTDFTGYEHANVGENISASNASV